MTTFFAQKLVLVIPWCPSWSCLRSCSHLESEMRSASSLWISPSSTVTVEACVKYFCRFLGTSEVSSSHPSMIICARAFSSGSAEIASWKADSCWVVSWVWRIVISNGNSGPGCRCYLDSASASIISLPGLYFKSKLYHCRCIMIH